MLVCSRQCASTQTLQPLPRYVQGVPPGPVTRGDSRPGSVLGPESFLKLLPGAILKGPSLPLSQDHF